MRGTMSRSVFFAAFWAKIWLTKVACNNCNFLSKVSSLRANFVFKFDMQTFCFGSALHLLCKIRHLENFFLSKSTVHSLKFTRVTFGMAFNVQMSSLVYENQLESSSLVLLTQLAPRTQKQESGCVQANHPLLLMGTY
jgi:hypothetical protein